MKETESNVIHTSSINPVDYFNRNHAADMLELMTSKNNVVKTSVNSIAYVMNKADETKHMIVLENGNFVSKIDNGLLMRVGDVYSPFMMLQRFIFKNNFSQALNYVMTNFMNIKQDYIRVGVKYFKVITKLDRFGIKRTELKVWDKVSILDDLGKDVLYDIPKYDDFTIVPDNKNYREIIGNNYNLYSPFEHKPCEEKDYDEIKWYWTRTLLEHVFGEQYELGIKYFKVLYDLPKQALPILVFTSEERETGKTTVVDYINILFGGNAVIINPQDISNTFNSTYADKNIICIEESRFENVQTTEKLKNLSTQKKIAVNTKFIQQYSLPFFGHLIITSNDENKFSKVDDPEIRYWVRQVPTLKGKANHNILNDLKNEIPQFLYYLNSLEDVDVSKSRMVFTAEELQTEALNTVKKESRPSLHKDIMIMLDQHCMDNSGIDEFKFTAINIKEAWFNNNSKIEVNYINKILKTSIKLERGKMQRFVPLELYSDINKRKISGRPYIFKNPYFNEFNLQQES